MLGPDQPEQLLSQCRHGEMTGHIAIGLSHHLALDFVGVPVFSAPRQFKARTIGSWISISARYDQATKRKPRRRGVLMGRCSLPQGVIPKPRPACRPCPPRHRPSRPRLRDLRFPRILGERGAAIGHGVFLVGRRLHHRSGRGGPANGIRFRFLSIFLFCCRRRKISCEHGMRARWASLTGLVSSASLSPRPGASAHARADGQDAAQCPVRLFSNLRGTFVVPRTRNSQIRIATIEKGPHGAAAVFDADTRKALVLRVVRSAFDGLAGRLHVFPCASGGVASRESETSDKSRDNHQPGHGVLLPLQRFWNRWNRELVPVRMRQSG